MNSKRSTIAAGVLCLVSLLIIGSCIGCGIVSFCFCDDAGVNAFYDDLAPDGSQDELDVQIEEESIEEVLDIEVRDSVTDLADLVCTGGQGALWATHFATII
jgi:hypothetical protein